MEKQIKKPNEQEVRESLLQWGNLESYVLQENSLKKLFLKTYPANNDIDDVLIKVCSLNDFYSTNIFSPCTVAKHIISLNIDEKLQRGDLDIVNALSAVTMTNYKMRNFYSFATKYCSHHMPDDYPIYDYFAEKLLLYFKKKDNFKSFSKDDLKNYPTYKSVILTFREYYDLQNFSLKEIDRYLWITGKEYFPRNNK